MQNLFSIIFLIVTVTAYCWSAHRILLRQNYCLCIALPSAIYSNELQATHWSRSVNCGSSGISIFPHNLSICVTEMYSFGTLGNNYSQGFAKFTAQNLS